jgi:hypothetical protein
MLKDHKFWVGVIVGVALYYAYMNYAAKKGK